MMKNKLYNIVFLAFLISSCSEKSNTVINFSDLTDKKGIVLKNNGPKYPNKITIDLNGWVKGKGMFLISDHGGYTDTLFVEGKITRHYEGEWYAEECLFKYQPLDKNNEGSVEISYKMN